MVLEGFSEVTKELTEKKPPKSRAAYQKAWAKKNPDKIRAYNEKYWSRRLGLSEPAEEKK